jgi:hypothetical protein
MQVCARTKNSVSDLPAAGLDLFSGAGGSQIGLQQAGGSPEGEAMSDEGAVEKVLLRAGELKFLGRNRAFITLLFAVWRPAKKLASQAI